MTISGVALASYNGDFRVLSSNPGVSFTISNQSSGLGVGTAFGTATMGGLVSFGIPGNELTTRPEWFGAIAEDEHDSDYRDDNFQHSMMHSRRYRPSIFQHRAPIR
jgi:hypothetical protein